MVETVLLEQPTANNSKHTLKLVVEWIEMMNITLKSHHHKFIEHIWTVWNMRLKARSDPGNTNLIGLHKKNV